MKFKEPRKFIVILLGAVVVSIFMASMARASESNGTIDPLNKYAWSSKAGWINFGNAHGDIHITDTAITGYAWSDLYGWMTMNPTHSGVQNNCQGVLSGYAWCEKLGWVNFSGVTINSAGKFTGQATGDNVGTINFDCSNCTVKTDWRLCSSRQGVGGGLLPPEHLWTPAPPFSILIDEGASETNTTTVDVKLIIGKTEKAGKTEKYGRLDTKYAFVSEDPKFLSNVIRVDFRSSTESINTIFTVNTPYKISDKPGVKIIYALFCTEWGLCRPTVSSSILYSFYLPFSPPTSTKIIKQTISTSTAKTILKKIKQIIGSVAPEKIISKIPPFLSARVPWEAIADKFYFVPSPKPTPPFQIIHPLPAGRYLLEGYVYENFLGKELRIPGAYVALYKLDTRERKYKEWPAQEFGQISPQITDKTGVFALAAPSGMYYIRATARGYNLYEGVPFLAEANAGVIYVVMESKYGWLKIIYIAIILLIVIILIGYGYYRKRRRNVCG